jgi:hypothetical protein
MIKRRNIRTVPKVPNTIEYVDVESMAPKFTRNPSENKITGSKTKKKMLWLKSCMFRKIILPNPL